MLKLFHAGNVIDNLIKNDYNSIFISEKKVMRHVFADNIWFNIQI